MFVRERIDVRALLVGPLVTITLQGCGSDRGTRSNVIVKDSAGIQIVESSAPQWREGEAWSISAQPLVQIGAYEGDETEQLFQVQGIARLSNGRIVVANAGTDELRVYSARGEYIRSVGREGSGPGEFTDPGRLWVLAEDTLVVTDWTKTVSVFDSAGVFVGSNGFGPWPVHDRFSDGSFLQLVIPPGPDAFLPGYSRPDVALIRARADGSAADTLARVTGDDTFRSVSDAGGVSSWYAPFGRTRTAAVYGDSIYTGDGAMFEVRNLDEQGTVVRIIRRSAERTAVTPAAIESFEAQMLREVQTDARRRRLQRLFREWTYPPFQPAYDQLVVDHEGNLWTRHYAIGSSRSNWSVFGPTGRWLGVIEMPADFTLKEIGSDYVLGVSVDDFGVEYVQLYALEKGDS